MRKRKVLRHIPHSAWAAGITTPPLDIPPILSQQQMSGLDGYVASTPSAEGEFSTTTWGLIADLGVAFIISVGRFYKAARAYVSYWRRVRGPTALIPIGLSAFEGRAQPYPVSFALDVATYGVRPVSMCPPVRYAQKPYAIDQDNPGRASCDMWGVW